MNSSDVISVIMDFLAKDEDAYTLLNCRLVCKKIKTVIDKYQFKYNTQFMKVAKLVNSIHGLSLFRNSLLNLLLVQTKISPFINDTWSLIRFMHIKDKRVNMENILNRLIPDNTKLGNNQSYEPTLELFINVIISFMNWLTQWHSWNHKSHISIDILTQMYNNDKYQTYWLILESNLNKLFRLLIKYKFLGNSSKIDWEIDYDYYSLYSTQNNTYSNKIELLLNKLKIIYQITQ